MTVAIVPTARSDKTGKIVGAREAARLIRTGDTVAIGGFFGIGLAMEVIHALAAIYEETDTEAASFGKPRDLTFVWCVSPGDGQQRGAQRLAQPGLIKRLIGGHWTAVPALYQLVAGNQIEGYNIPLGPLSHLYRDIAAGKPGHLSRVGLGTFADPRFGGGKLNERTTEDLIELMTVGGKEYLFYKAFPINVALIRGTTADTAGNMTMEREALTVDTLSLAMAAHNSGASSSHRSSASPIWERSTHARSRSPARLSTASWWRRPPTTTCRPSPRPTTRPSPPKFASR
ncbi:CoA-transferase [Bradyrhizobium tropiciagri]|uniref:CoA-transferase n=1 Tax=Bradyrhizobium tropiciagri TaxID=312253 RepID=UPI000A6D9676